MTTVSSTSSTSASTSAAAKTSASSSADIQDRFLNLLVAQISNQDPLNPMDNAQLTSQLAQISTVTGIEGHHDAVVAGQQSGRSAGDAVRRHDRQGGAGSRQEPDAHQERCVRRGQAGRRRRPVTVTIKDAKGNVVATETLGAQKAGNVSFSRDGKATDGSTAADGDYTFTVAAVQGTDKVTAEALQYGTVSAVTRASDSFALDLGALGTFKFSDVQQVL